MNRLLIIGYGNRSRGDDGVGYRAAERLHDRLAGTGIEVLAVHQLTPELMDAVARAERVIFIDAGVQGQPGEIRMIDLDASGASEAFTHHGRPAALLSGAAKLYGSSATGVLYSIAGQSFEFGEELTPAVERAMGELVTRLVDCADSSRRTG